MRINILNTININNNEVNLIKERGINYSENLNSPEKIKDFLNKYFLFNKLTEERLYLLCFNTKMMPIGIFEVSRGSIDVSLVPIREILMKSLLCNAPNIILSHNHPSGNFSPSSDDLNSTRNLKKATDIVGINLCDHIIVAGKSYYSMKEKGIL